MVTRPDGEVDIVPVEHPITIKNIMNMTCGLPYQMIMGFTPVRHPTAEAMAKAMEPVSYTHLDVYKRQLLTKRWRSLKPFYGLIRRASLYLTIFD